MKAMIFDMDGVIIDSEICFIQRTIDISNQVGQPVSFEEAKHCIGFSYDNFLSYCVNRFQVEISIMDEMITRYNEEHPLDYSKLINEDTIELINYLKKKGYCLALASSTYKDRLKKKLEDCQLENTFDLVVSGDQVARRKPYPDIYLKTAKLLDISVNDCIVFEDSKVGIQAAHDANMKVIARIDKRLQNDTSLADYAVEDMRKVIELFEKKR